MNSNAPHQIQQAQMLLREGLSLFQRNQFDEAEKQFRQALKLAPNHPEGLHLLGLVSSERNQPEAAAQLIEQSLRLLPNNAVAWNNLGNVYRTQFKWQQAYACYERAVSIQPNYPLALSNKGSAARELNLPQVARACYREAMNDPRLRDGCQGAALQVEMELCDWSHAAEIHTDLRDAIRTERFNLPSFSMLAMLDEPDLHLIAAKTFGAANAPAQAVASKPTHATPIHKIRVGYFSADFHEHATAWLMADLFEQHDRERFEWHAFSFGPSLNDAMRQRLVKGFDHFHAVESLSDDEVVDMAHRLGIEVAVDLKGYTKDSRPGIFARRVAPVQVNYLGYPGSMGVPYMDYVLADHVVIPDGTFDHYTEQVARLPQCYQPNDSKRTRPTLVLGRAAFGLPEDAFVFCSFNNNYKITPEQFARWVAILKRVPNSVLWLYVAHPDAVNNLREAARQAGLAPERLLFATKVAHESHVLRYACADLFLDTFPYNAHTTASDALSMGLPLVTLQGRSFASRVAASLLHACDLPDLITETPEDYVALAVQLANQPDRLKAYRQHLITQRNSLKLFDTASLARAIEQALQTMVERSRAGLAPAHFDVPAGA